MDEQVPKKARTDVGMPEKIESDYVKEQKTSNEELKRRTSEILEEVESKYASKKMPERKVEITRKKESPSKLKIIGKKVIDVFGKMGKELVEPTETATTSRIYETPEGRVMEQTIQEKPKSALFEWTERVKTRKLIEPYPGAGFKVVEDWKTTEVTKTPIPETQHVLARRNIMDVLNGALLSRELDFSGRYRRRRRMPFLHMSEDIFPYLFEYSSFKTGRVKSKIPTRKISAPEFRRKTPAEMPTKQRSPIFQINYQHVSNKMSWIRRPIAPSNRVLIQPHRLYARKKPMTHMIYRWLSNA